jgi:hypothetical protein
MGGNGTVKYAVTDPNAKFVPGPNTTGATTETISDNATGTNVVVSAHSDLISLAHSNANVGDGSYYMWSSTGINLDKGTPGAADVLILAPYSLVEVYVDAGFLYFKSASALTSDPTHVDGAATLNFVRGGSLVADTSVAVADDVTTLNPDYANETLTTVATSGNSLGAGTYLAFTRTAGGFNLDKSTNAQDDLIVLAVNEPTLATVTTAGVMSFKSDIDLTDETHVDGAVTMTFVSVPSAVRASDNSYVVDTEITAAGSTANLEMVATDAVTRSVTVQAFVDDFANNKIDAGSEYTSVAQTIQFVENDDVSVVTNLVAPTPGDSKLTATITTSPMINGAEDDRTNPIGAIFTRQDSVTKGLAVATQAASTGLWTAEVNTDISATAVSHWVNSTTVLDSENWMKSYTGTTGVRMDDAQEALARVDRARVVIAGLVATVTTQDGGVTDALREAHFLQVGDKVTFGGAAVAGLTSLQFTVASVPSAFTFTVAVATGTAASTTVADNTNQAYTVTTYGAGVALRDRVYAGDHSAVGALTVGTNLYETSGATSSSGTLTQTAADTFVTTVGSATVQEASVNNQAGDTTTDALIKKDVKSVAVLASVVDKNGVSVGAGRSVAATVVVNSGGSAVKVNGLTAPANQVTDANGQVTFTVTDGIGASGTKVTLKLVPEGTAAAGTDFTIEWATQAYALYDLNTTEGALTTDDRQVLAGTSYAMDLLVADQWYQPAPSETYRLKVTGSGVTEGIQTLVAGKAAVTISDLGIGTSFATNLIVQKATAGVFADSSTTTITTKTAAAATTSVVLAADGSALYASATADLSDAVAAKALVERDNRTAFVSQPAYTSGTGGAVVVTGKVTKKSNGTSANDAVVTISGSNSILFSDGLVDKRGGVTVVANDSGEFSVTLYSTSAMTNSVITVTAMGVSATTKVSFVGAGVGEGVSLVITMPAAVKPASTFQVKAKLADVFGNGVVTAAGAIKVTYSGAGIVFGTLPTKTDDNGELMFSVLLGSNDTGSVNVTVSYDQNADGDYLDAKDLVIAGTTAITATGLVAAAASDTIVNVGTFSGKLVVYALNAAGSEVSYKIAGKWVTQVVTSDLLMRYDRVVGATGATIKVDIYVDGVLKLAKSVVTK